MKFLLIGLLILRWKYRHILKRERGGGGREEVIFVSNNHFFPLVFFIHKYLFLPFWAIFYKCCSDLIIVIKVT